MAGDPLVWCPADVRRSGSALQRTRRRRRPGNGPGSRRRAPGADRRDRQRKRARRGRRGRTRRHSRAWSGRTERRLPGDAHRPGGGPAGNRAQAPEQGVLPGQFGRPRSRHRGRRRPAPAEDRLGLCLLPGPGAGHRAGADPPRAVGSFLGRRFRSLLGRKADAFALLQEIARPDRPLELCGNTVPARGRNRVRGALSQPPPHPGAARRPERRRDRAGERRRRRHQRGRVLGITEQRGAPPAAGPVPDPGQRLRDLGAGGTPDRGRVDRPARPGLPRSEGPRVRRLRLRGVLPHPRGGLRLRPLGRGAGARPCPRGPPAAPLAFGRGPGLQDAGGTRFGSGPRSAGAPARSADRFRGGHPGRT